MGRVVRLAEIVERLSEFDGNDTIYALEPWTEDSDAIVAPEPKSGGLPPEAAEAGMKYFLEISIASDFVEDWITSLKEKPSSSAVCQRLIQYAINDA
ncbi:hypothetical protein FRZ44_17330 [Hypericibacter terrae]|uniref:Uncharacterized protein n=1 Tax=Hypericibacter terrae TaxID=2602015 RepID=A0A5J6MJI3_9PROT|nr:hypothetical protein [Hypericibacter terrae]QEX16440.1 hypothetical protein FRZ44_17330 [Hypericibacter terrae]